ncbi:hypothetical protein G5C66_16275 [Nocardioides sp. KC13]|uniref:Uncharacterized protein n=1 Tax=Nocardioides turkmenicus TaxID=2711220 RepID=A0A6M1R9X7_9ACTN|nr:hypothetical protein [Nocardioides sp. KC13]NGN94289.1 hypothetical protein [Nocardioides sp. KC13]
MVPIETGRAYSIWYERGLGWFGALVSELLTSVSFLWGTMVRYEHTDPPVSAWPTVVFALVLVAVVYTILRNGPEAPGGVAGRVLAGALIAGGLTNLFGIVLHAARMLEYADSFASFVPVWSDDGVWLGIIIGAVGGFVAYTVALLIHLASTLREGADSAEGRRRPASAVGRTGARWVATCAVMPLLLVVLVGGLVWDYGPDADVDAFSEPRDRWVRLVWFLHARLGAPADPTSLSGTFDTSVWLPRALTSAAFLMLLWVCVLLLVARWRGGGKPNVVGVVLQVWGLVAVVAIVVGLLEGVVLPPPYDGMFAYHIALGNVTDAVRFATCFGWLAGVAVALARRPSDGPAVEAEPDDVVLEGSVD